MKPDTKYKIIKVPDQTEISSVNGFFSNRPITGNTVQNGNKLIDRYDNSNDETFEHNFDISNIPQYIFVEDFKKMLYELMIRFDTNPKNYQKDDFYILIKILKNTLFPIINGHNIDSGVLDTITREDIDNIFLS